MSFTIITRVGSVPSMGWSDMVSGAPFERTSFIKSWPSNFSPFRAIKSVEEFILRLSVEMSVMVEEAICWVKFRMFFICWVVNGFILVPFLLR